jgi:hypothetical protein
MVRKLPAYMTEILLGKGVKLNKQTNKIDFGVEGSKVKITLTLKVITVSDQSLKNTLA